MKETQKSNNHHILHMYYFKMYTEFDPEYWEIIWKEAYSESETRDVVFSDFHNITSLDLIRVE